MERAEILEELHFLNQEIPKVEKKEDVAMVEEMMEYRDHLELELANM